MPIVRLLGRFFARSTTATRVPIAGPSRVMSEKMPAAWPALVCFDFRIAMFVDGRGVKARR